MPDTGSLEMVRHPPSIEAEVIASRDFCSRLDKLRSLRDFVVAHNVKDQSKSEPASIVIGKFNSFHYGENGRQPSDAEWDELNAKLQYFYGLLDETERRKFHFAAAAPMLKTLPMLLVIASIAVLIIPILYGEITMKLYGEITTTKLPQSVVFTVFLLWTVVVGAPGGFAFVLLNALGIEVDPTIDVTDRNSMWFRVLLGALFSVILTFPFGYKPFYLFNMQILNAQLETGPQQAALLFMPFLFGFSTSLVLTVLNRLAEGVQTFFGVSSRSVQRSFDERAKKHKADTPNT